MYRANLPRSALNVARDLYITLSRSPTPRPRLWQDNKNSKKQAHSGSHMPSASMALDILGGPHPLEHDQHGAALRVAVSLVLHLLHVNKNEPQ